MVRRSSTTSWRSARSTAACKMAKQKNALREINLEIGRPFVDQAMQRLTMELDQSRRMGCAVLKIIHGYGSSGVGGKIRTASRKHLAQLKEQGKITDVLPGEGFSIFEEATRRAFLRCDALRQDRDLDRYNRGVTFIVF